MSDNVYNIHFVPGEIMLVIDHQEEFNLRTLQDTLESFIPRVLGCELKTYNYEDGEDKNGEVKVIKSKIIINNERITTFWGQGEAASNRSFVKVRLYDNQADPSSDIYIQHGLWIVVDMMRGLYQENNFDNELNKPGLYVRSITPNWLNAGSQSSLTNGGPGSKPITHMGCWNAFEPPETKSEDFKPLDEGDECSRVDIVVLDTIPTYTGADGLQKHGDAAIGAFLDIHPNQKIEDLRKKLEIYEDRVGYDYINTTKYPTTMSDHGLFVAGIIHKIAPKIGDPKTDINESPIHLIQVLNDNGVGTLESLTRGVCCAIDQTKDSDAPLVVNMSLTFAIPRGTTPYTRLQEPDINYTKNLQFVFEYNTFMNFVAANCDESPAFNVKALRRIFLQPINDLMEALRSLSCSQGKPVYLIAAAGNDSKGQTRPDALYPAAFPYVTGVGALTSSYSEAMKTAATKVDKAKQDDTDIVAKNEANQAIGLASFAAITAGSYTSFSNIADFPRGDGIRTLGEMVVGPYLNATYPDESTPNFEENTSGLAKWSGTSFATPIIAGMVALLLQKNISFPLSKIRDVEPDPASPTQDFGVSQPQ
jgi:hypothetical protein